MEEDQSQDDVKRPPGFGEDLKEVRLGRKLTQEHVATGTGFSRTYVSKVESGSVFPSEKFAYKCDLVFGTHGMFERLRRRITESDHPSWFVPFVQMERDAVRIQNFSSSLVMGLLQTEEYARAIFRAANPRMSDEVIEGKVAARLRRREIFDGGHPPELWVILSEACLRYQVGGRAVMAGQLEHLVDCALSAHISMQVLPFRAGAPNGVMQSFTVLGFDGSPTKVYSDDPLVGSVNDNPRLVSYAVSSYDRLMANAEPPAASLDFVRMLLKEYRS
ncbi:helix-turn-helix transcriptional regulator [Streptomyces sp. NPDC049879]|uniref:helix-turn-helix transcriptional regulator n=1 Tax=Streptomyces sp. NPDC049879 TaxID=3365598 RepID=UPI00379E2F76